MDREELERLQKYARYLDEVQEESNPDNLKKAREKLYDEFPQLRGCSFSGSELTDKILLVDDDAEIVSAMRCCLKNEEGIEGRYEILEANDGNKAIEVFDAKKPRVIVLDIFLPRMSGFLVYEKIKESRKGKDMPYVVLITALEGKRHRQYAEALGVNDYLNKPFKMEKLIESVKRGL